MTDEEVLAAACSDPDAQPLDPEALAKMSRISTVKALRQRLGMTQVEFAEALGCPSAPCGIGNRVAALPMHQPARCCERSSESPRQCDVCCLTRPDVTREQHLQAVIEHKEP